MLNPTEYYYLTKPLVSCGAIMLKYTLQDLCLRNVLNVEQKWIRLNKRDKRKRLRFFFSQGSEFDNFETNNKYENFILKPFYNNAELRFYVIRQYIKKELEKDVHKYKREYVFNDLKRNGLCYFRFFPTSKGKLLRNEITKSIDRIETLIDVLIEKNSKILIKELEKLGSNILFLTEDTIEKLDNLSDDIAKIYKLRFLGKNAAGFSTMNTFFAMNTSAFGAAVFSSSGGFGGFSGFSGGSFGGGAAGGSW